MKPLMILMFLLCGLTVHAQTPSKQEQRETQNFELLNSLLQNGQASLKGRKFCEDAVQNKHGTVAKFVAWSLSFYEQGKVNSVQSVCENTSKLKTCTVYFNADSNGDSPWACGLRFKYDSNKKQIDVSTLECVGSC